MNINTAFFNQDGTQIHLKPKAGISTRTLIKEAIILSAEEHCAIVFNYNDIDYEVDIDDIVENIITLQKSKI